MRIINGSVLCRRGSNAVLIGLMAAGLATLEGQVTLSVPATADIYRAGDYNDGSDGVSPAIYSFPARAMQTLSFSGVNGTWDCSRGDVRYGADGTSTGPCYPNAGIANPVGPFSGYSLTDFTGALAGVFLKDTLGSTAPPPLRFYASDSSLGGIQNDFTTLSPLIGQVFFIGDGLTGTATGSVQNFRVPATATHLYLGYVKSCSASGSTAPGCYSSNSGFVSAILSLQQHALDWVQLTPATAPSARCCASMVYDAATKSTVLFGGGNGGVRPEIDYGDTWIWNEGWSQRSPSVSPGARQAAAMAYDPATGTVVLFGGYAQGAVLGDTWTWDGITWTKQSPPVSPAARQFTMEAMAYDPVTETVLFFGGATADQTVFSDTWEWNGKTKTWKEIFPATSPPARIGMLAYDDSQGQIILFGGTNAAGDCCNAYYNDTWSWNGITWTQEFPASSPSARAYGAMAYDPAIGDIVLFGGFDVPGEGLDDTWTWNGSTWLERTPATEPGGRWSLNVDFDPAATGLLLFGGEVSGDPFTNQTWVFASVPVP